MYSVPNLRVTFGRARRNIGATSDMRGPGAVPGLYATESAMNELADLLKMDPVQLRVLNEPKIDEGLGIPFSSRHLVECFELGAEKFGWSQRTPEVGSMKRDGLTLGWGMAGCAWIAARFAAEASVAAPRRWTARVACATQDIGTGTYTILAQLAAEKTGVPLDKVEVVLGDTSLPAGPLSGGSMATGFGDTRRICGGRQRGRLAACHRDDDAGLAVREETVERSGVRKRCRFHKGEGPARAYPSPICFDGPKCRQVSGSGSVVSDLRQSKAEIFNAFLRLSLRGGCLAAGNRSLARQPSGHRHRCGADSQPAGRPQPDRGRAW